MTGVGSMIQMEMNFVTQQQLNPALHVQQMSQALSFPNSEPVAMGDLNVDSQKMATNLCSQSVLSSVRPHCHTRTLLTAQTIQAWHQCRKGFSIASVVLVSLLD